MDKGYAGAANDGERDLKGRGDDAQIDVASAVASRIFGGTISLRIPFWKASAIEAQASQAQQLDDAGMTIKSGPLGQKTREQIKAEKDEENTEGFRHVSALIAEEARQQEEWLRTRSSIGGVEMTGKEWGEFAERLRTDEKLRRKIIDAFEAQGMSEQEAQRRYQRVVDVADAMKVPPSQRTEEQAALIEKAKSDPSFQRDITTADNAAQSLSAPKAAVSQVPAPALAVSTLDGP